MRYDQYYLVHRLIENLSGGEEEEEGILEVMVTSVLRNGCDKNCLLVDLQKLLGTFLTK